MSTLFRYIYVQNYVEITRIEGLHSLEYHSHTLMDT